jgi:hypothetical protein
VLHKAANFGVYPGAGEEEGFSSGDGLRHDVEGREQRGRE